MVAEKALVTFEIAAIEEFAFSFFSKEKNFSSFSFQSLSKPLNNAMDSRKTNFFFKGTNISESKNVVTKNTYDVNF